MHAIEPHYNWRDYYIASEDERSPFYGRIYSEFEFTHAIYDHVIHPQWDEIESPTLYIKILYVDYDQGFATIEMIGENVLNYHASDDSYYEEWFEDVEDGWIAFINFREHVMADFAEANIDYYLVAGGELDELNWRLFTPQTMFQKVESLVVKRLGV